jgi:aspartate 1-decarboxylase
VTRHMLRAKLHRATVTHADVDYEGSVTIDADLLDAADILEHEAVHVWNVTRGTRLMTYALPAPRGSRVVCINGAAAHLVKPKDLVIIASFGEMSDEEAKQFTPKVLLLDSENRIRALGPEIPGPSVRRMPLHP